MTPCLRRLPPGLRLLAGQSLLLGGWGAPKGECQQGQEFLHLSRMSFDSCATPSAIFWNGQINLLHDWHSYPEARGLNELVTTQPLPAPLLSASFKCRIQPITAPDSAQLMLGFDQSRQHSQTILIRTKLRKSPSALFRAISDSLLLITSGLLTYDHFQDCKTL